MLQGHPDMKGTPGVDMSTGSLGQGISAAVGMALAAKLDGAPWRTYAVLGDGEIEEGQVWEAAMFAAHKKLDNLCVVVDNNNLQIDGTVEEVNSPYPIPEKFEAFGSMWRKSTATILTKSSGRSRPQRPVKAGPPPSSRRPTRAAASRLWRTR